MSHVFLVRHAQASFLEPNYDRLCANGETQARLLGEFWGRRAVSFGSAWSGSSRRHVHTARIVGEAYGSFGSEFPGVNVMNEFDEYPAEAVLRLGLPQLLGNSEEIDSLHATFQGSKEPDERKKNFQKMFEAVIARWVSGELTIAGTESWVEFCARVDRGLEKLQNATTGDAVVFTSGGPIGVALRRALNLSHADTLQMTWRSRNASFSEFLASGGRFSLSAFNSVPHLHHDSLLTYR